VVVATRQAIARQQDYDRDRHGRQGMLLARMAAVLGAQRALAERQEGAHAGLRGALVDLAAVAELLADDLDE
jgi:hypothetical protein